MTNLNIQKTESDLFRALGNGIAAASLFADLVNNAAETRNTDMCLRAVVRAMGKGDENAASKMQTVLKAVFPGSKFRKTKNDNVGFVLNGAQADQAALARMRDAVDAKLSLRGTFADVVAAKPKVDYDLLKAVQAFIKKAKDNGHSDAAVDAAIKAARASRDAK